MPSLLRRLSLRPSLSLGDDDNEQLERPPAAGRRAGQAGQEGDSSANGRVEQEAAELFIGYEVPFDRPGVPFEPSRTLDVDPVAWWYYTDPGSFRPAGWIERTACCLMGYCGGPPGRRLKQRRQQSRKILGQQATAAAQDWDLEDQKAAAPGGDGGKGRARRYRSAIGLPILSPESRVVRVWETVISMLDMTYTAYLVPLSLAFDSMTGAHFTWFNAANVAGTVFYLVDILAGFHTGFIVTCDVKQALVMQGPKVADYYIRHGGFFLDVVATLPIIPELVLSAVPSDTTAYKWFYVLRLLRLVRVFRLLKVWGGTVFTNSISRWLQRYMSTAGLYLLNLVLALSVLVNLMGCIWWFVAEIEGLDNSWAAAVELNVGLLEAPDPARWVASVFFAMTTMTTVGYGDITPVTPAEQLVGMLFMVFSVFYFSFIINFVGDLLHGASRTARQADMLRHKLEDIEAWLKERHIPAALQAKVRRYFVQVWAPHAGIDDSQYFEDLPVELRGEIVSQLAGEMLRRSNMFKLMDETMRAQLASVAMPVRLVAGHNLFEEGDAADSFYVLQEGEAINLRGAHVVGRLHGPAVVGQAAVFSHYVEECRSRLHTVRAETNCTLWEFRGAHLAKMLKHSPSFLPPLCRSYLQYLQDLRERVEARGQAVPKRVHRIEREIQSLMARVEAKLERQSDAGSPPVPATPLADPPGSPDQQRSLSFEASVRRSSNTAAAREGAEQQQQQQQQQNRLSRRSLPVTVMSVPSEAVPEEEQLQPQEQQAAEGAATPALAEHRRGGSAAATREAASAASAGAGSGWQRLPLKQLSPSRAAAAAALFLPNWARAEEGQPQPQAPSHAWHQQPAGPVAAEVEGSAEEEVPEGEQLPPDAAAPQVSARPQQDQQ